MSELESDDGYDFYGSGRSERYSESESDDLEEEEEEGVRARHAQDDDDSDHMVPPTLQMCSKHKPGCMRSWFRYFPYDVTWVIVSRCGEKLRNRHTGLGCPMVQQLAFQKINGLTIIFLSNVPL